MMVNNTSQVALLRQKIADEYQAAKLGLTGLAFGVGKHRFITARMEHMGDSFAELTNLVGSPEEAIKIVAETLDSLPGSITRGDIVNILKRLLGDTEETAHLVDWLRDTWETSDILTQRFGKEATHKIIHAPASLCVASVDSH